MRPMGVIMREMQAGGARSSDDVSIWMIVEKNE